MKSDETKIEKYKFKLHKNPIWIHDVDINKILVPNKVSLGKKGFKYSIGYKVNNTVKKGFNSKPVYNEKYLRTKINLMAEKSAQILTETEYQKKVLNVFVYQYY